MTATIADNAIRFFVPRMPHPPTESNRRAVQRGDASHWYHWCRGLTIFGLLDGPVKGSIDHPVDVVAVVKWPRNGQPITEDRVRYWREGIAAGLDHSKIIPLSRQRSLEVRWLTVHNYPVAQTGVEITITDAQEDDV